MNELATYDLGGNGRTLVIVHGYTGSSDDFADVAQPLTDQRRVLLVDQLGHGASPRRKSYSLGALIETVAAVLVDIGEPVDLLGHSMGGRTVLPIAIERPELVASLILMDTWADPPDWASERDPLLEILALPDAEAITEIDSAPPPPPSPEDDLIAAEWGAEWLEAHYEHNSGRDPLAVVHLGRELYLEKTSLLPGATSISSPTTVLVGELDELFVAPSQRMAGAIPDAELIVIRGAYHSPQLSHPNEWRAAIRKHLERSSLRSPY